MEEQAGTPLHFITTRARGIWLPVQVEKNAHVGGISREQAGRDAAPFHNDKGKGGWREGGGGKQYIIIF